MRIDDGIALLRRGLRKPPGYAARWLFRRVCAGARRARARRWARELDRDRLLRELGAADPDSVWRALAARPFPGAPGPIARAAYDALCPGDADRILRLAAAATDHRVDLLGSGPVMLGRPIDWQRDPHSGKVWPLAPAGRIDYADPGNPSDVKRPWEAARLQWLIPAAQAWLLTGEERYAEAARAVIEDWIAANPYGLGIHWAIATEAAFRAITLIWLFRALHGSVAWRDDGFRLALLRLLFLHGHFIEHHLEISDINGNHYDANSAGLACLGLFFGRGARPARWSETGWRMLADALPRQVFADGVDFEASSAYHRLAAELFLLPALYRRALRLEVAERYVARLRAMADFTAACTRPDGTVPQWGDADDARVLPFGGQHINDHRYLPALIGAAFGDAGTVRCPAPCRAELFWLLGADAASHGAETDGAPASAAFAEGGVYIMRSAADHVFIDCGPVGLAGRGGHGHNDCLSFEAVLLGSRLIVDSGCYVYTASTEWRNRFRGTAAHNTPMIDGAEQNRFVRPDLLWLLEDDARPRVVAWRITASRDLFVGSHDGYRRLAPDLAPVRRVMLDKAEHRLVIVDGFEGVDERTVTIPFHLAPDVAIAPVGPGLWRLGAPTRDFLFIAASAPDWSDRVRAAWHAPSYGVRQPTSALEFSRTGPLRPLATAIVPADGAPADPLGWLDRVVREDVSPSSIPPARGTGSAPPSR